MAKGFGEPSKGDLGFALLLLPEARCFAASSDDDNDSEFIGVTNMLESAKLWSKKSQVRQATIQYASFLIERLEEEKKSEFSVQIRKVIRLKNGKLKDELAEEIIFLKEDQKTHHSSKK